VLRQWAIAVALVLTWATTTRADVFRPAYLELRQTSAETYDVMWKVPAQGDTLRLAIRLVFPEGTVNLSEPRGHFTGDGFLERWSIRRAGGLANGKVRIDGLPGTVTDVLARVERRGARAVLPVNENSEPVATMGGSRTLVLDWCRRYVLGYRADRGVRRTLVLQFGARTGSESFGPGPLRPGQDVRGISPVVARAARHCQPGRRRRAARATTGDVEGMRLRRFTFTWNRGIRGALSGSRRVVLDPGHVARLARSFERHALGESPRFRDGDASRGLTSPCSGQPSRQGSDPLSGGSTTRTDNDQAASAGVGGESGIRTLLLPLESVSYRFHDATVAVNAGDAMAHCPLLPAR
jgi:hypothetical protein